MIQGPGRIREMLMNLSHEDMKELRCMSYTSKGNSEILVAGLQDRMFTIDVERGTVSKQVHPP